jgi:hypothetical protein
MANGWTRFEREMWAGQSDRPGYTRPGGMMLRRLTRGLLYA